MICYNITTVVFLFLLVSSIGYGQASRLPDILKPDAFSVSEGRRLGGEVFKILPRGMFKDVEGSYKDEDNPLGIRQGGAYYSFTNRNHSYNRVPQIGLDNGAVGVGFYGASLGFMMDLGVITLPDVTRELAASQFLLNYRPPKLEPDIRAEYRRIHTYKVDGRAFSTRAPAVVEHTYLLRAISFGEADKLVAFQIIKMDADGALEIAWKSLNDFDVPRIMYQTEDELRTRVAAILEKEEYSGVKFTVKDDVVTLSGSLGSFYLARLMLAVNQLRPGKVDNQIVVKQ